MKRRSSQIMHAFIALVVALSLILPVSSVLAKDSANVPGIVSDNQWLPVGDADIQVADDATSLPQGVSRDWWTAVQENIRTSEYQVVWQDDTNLADVSAAYQAPNRAQNLRTYFTSLGIRIVPRSSTAPEWELGLTLAAYGYEGNSQTMDTAELVVDGNRVEYRWDNVTEWYLNGESGLEQGFTIFSPPAHHTGVDESDEPKHLVLELALSGSLTPALSYDGRAIEFSTVDGVGVLRYGYLYATDASGHQLPSSMSLDESGISILVDDNSATYPITVDPLMTASTWTVESDQVEAQFATSVATAGDVNGDGYADVIIGAPYYDNGETDEGRAFVYYGDSSGLSITPDWTAESNQMNTYFGYSVATAGDVNGDGYADVIVGAPQYDNGQTNEGRACVYHGSIMGLSTTPGWMAESDQANAYFGSSVATAGDVNGDGYADVIIGLPQYDNGQNNEGRAAVYHGSSAGLSTAADWTAESNQVGASFGFSVATAGDVNGDGCADVIVGAPSYSNGQALEGMAFVYHGSSAGLSTAADWTAEGDQDSAHFGFSVATAGDVNGDGYSDVIVGAPHYDNAQGDAGRAFVYYGWAGGLKGTTVLATEQYQGVCFGWSVATAGDVNGDGYSDVIVGAESYHNGEMHEGMVFFYYGSITGLGTAPDWTAEGDQDSAHFGFSVATAGDVNGDGYSDVIVGAPYYENGQTDEGTAFIYYGSASGLSSTPDWTAEGDLDSAHFGWSVATAGDVNGDGYSDVIVGAPHYENGQEQEGRAFVYYGSSLGLSAVADWTAESDQANAKFGSSVATAGDVNGDGFADVIVGAPIYENGQAQEGRAFAYYGSATGLSTTADWTAESDQVQAQFGSSVATAGDVNGDGFADVIVGAPYYDNGELNEGRVLIYYGSSTGLNTDAGWMAEGDQTPAYFGLSVATAGDVNGDGYADVIIGAPGYTNGQEQEGRAFVYYGSSAGLSTTADWTAESDQINAGFGQSVARAGDANGDGFADVIVGANDYTNGQGLEGRAFVYYGSSAGLSTTADWTAESNQYIAWFGFSVATAGDINGDGYADVIVGAYRYDNEQTDEGMAFVYYGNGGSELGMNPRQRRSDDSAPIAHLGISDIEDAFLLALIGRTPFGRGKVKLQWEVNSLGMPFNSTDLSITGWGAESNQVQAWLGASVATAGDVNGDGYDDVIVGVPYYDNGETNEGMAFVYHGSASGLDTAPDWVAESNSEWARFGCSVATGGDINGDGYADVIIGAESYGYPSSEGKVFAYYGSSSGLSTDAGWTAEGDQAYARFGFSVATAGDVNGDGYDDIIVGAPQYTMGKNSEGKAFFYYGSATGLSSTADWTAEGNQANAYFGLSVATAGDVNGDGYDDIIVGADKYDNGQTDEGRAFVYYGSSAGLGSIADWTAESDQASASFGRSVATAGDVNRDGYADVIVGASYYENGQAQEGRAFVYYGSSAGLGSIADWTAESDQVNAGFGSSVATAGDVNGDGYADVIIGVSHYDSGQNNEGRAFVYYGSVGGLSTAADLKVESNQDDAQFGYSAATAGDVNGDGYDDIIVGAPDYENGQTQEGKAFVYYGSATGPNATTSWTAESTNWTDTSTAGIELKELASGLSPGMVYHWRVRLHYHPATTPFQQFSRWLTIPWNGWQEADLRTFMPDPNLSVSPLDHDFGNVMEGHSSVPLEVTITNIGGGNLNISGMTLSDATNYYLGLATLGDTAGWTAESNQVGASFGSSVATAGDVNGDGCADVIVGAPYYDNGETNEGMAFVYYGNSSGLNATPDWTAQGSQAEALFGSSVATAGDVNGDGYSDVIVGAPFYGNGQAQEGRAFVYYGSSAGLSTTAGWTAESNQYIAWFGFSVATAGDVNGDGYDDVIVGAPAYDNGQEDEGRAFVFHGSATGLSTTPEWTAESDQLSAKFGYSVATAGDVNGDGYDDVIVGAPYYDNPMTDEGMAFVYYGSASGLNATPNWTAESNQEDAGAFGCVATAGDVNGDGYADVIIGLSQYDNGQNNEGRAAVFYGSGSGLSATPNWTAERNQADAWFGLSVATAGDVNGDGYDDVIVGAPSYDNGQNNEGSVFIYYGSAAGLSTAPSLTAEGDQVNAFFGVSVATAGDVNGDGYTDVIVGAPMYENEQAEEGCAFVYYNSRIENTTPVILAGENHTVIVSFSPASVGTFAGNLTIESNDPDEPSVSVWLEGKGVEAPGPPPNIAVSPPSHNFGDVMEGASSPLEVTISNAGVGDLNISAMTLSDTTNYSLDVNAGSNPAGSTTPVIPAGENRTVTVTFIPSSVGTFAADLTIDSDDPDEPSVSVELEGNGVGPDIAVSLPSHNFGDVMEGTSSPLEVTISNTGTADLNISAMTLSDTTNYSLYVAELSTTPAWTAEGDQASAWFGMSVATAGDVNGDGFADVIVAAPAYDNGQEDEGRAFVFHGSATGPSTTPEWTAESDQLSAKFGNSVATAGDVNGDGFADVIVGASYYDNPMTDEGRAFVYYGSASGLSISADWTAESDQVAAYFAYSVATAGDVNGDGYADVIVGAPYYDNDETDEGMAFVYYGSASGLSTSANWTAESNQLSAKFGNSVATAGDVNGDGYADVIMAAPRYDNGQDDEGRAFVYRGSGSGLSATPDWTAESNQEDAGLYSCMATAGDVNGDGYDDVFIGLPYYDSPELNEGVAAVFYGSGSGLSATPAWVAESDQADAYFGYSVATAGDVDADGYADIIVGAPNYDNAETDEGMAFVYSGSSAGLSTSADWTAESNQMNALFSLSAATAGDVNGDGYADVIIGAHTYDSPLFMEGMAYVYYGSANGGSNPAGSTTPLIPAGEDRTVTVTFNPASVGTFTANLTIDSDDPDTSSLSIPLTGNGTADTTPHIVTLIADPVYITANGTSTSALAATVKDKYDYPVPDGTDVVFNTDRGTLGSSTIIKQTVGGVATATIVSEASTDAPIIATVTAEANGAQDAVAVFFIPQGKPGVVESETTIVTGSGTITDTATGGDVSIESTGDHAITIARYEDNPGDTPTFTATGDYYDVHLDEDAGVTSLTIEFPVFSREHFIYYWDGTDWRSPSDQAYNASENCWIVTITDTTLPSLADLAGLVLASGCSVKIDIKPGSDPNSINLKSKGLLPVAILTTLDFDASSVNPGTVLFAGAEAQRCTLEDVDEDGDLDLLCFFEVQDLDLDEDAKDATLKATTFDGDDIMSTDSVSIVPPK